jgi:hypothetical protein
MAFGTGSAVAHRAVDAVMGPRTIQHEAMVSEAAAPSAPAASSMGGADACNIHSKAFQDVCEIFSSGYFFAKISHLKLSDFFNVFFLISGCKLLGEC